MNSSGERSVDNLFNILGRQIGYARGYSKNIEKLGRRLDALQVMHRTIQIKIDTANNNGDSVWTQVLDWSEKAEQIEAETKEFLEEEANYDSARCLKGLSPSSISRCRAGKKALEKTIAVYDHETLGRMYDGEADISDPASPLGFESRRSDYEEIMKALKDESIHIIGIWGMGGVGKTTMAAEVGHRAKKDHVFDEVAMVVVSKDPNVRNIREELGVQLKLEMNDDNAEFNMTSRLCKCNRLKDGKRYLVILDDVWKKLNLKDIGIPFPDEATSSWKVLLTTREQSAIPVQKLIPVNALSQKQAWNLFEKKVGNTIDSDEMRVVARNVCNECPGLPVAILAIAGALKNERKDRWDDVLQQLRNYELENIGYDYGEVRACIEVSYNQLKSEEAKSCFLFCCMFPEEHLDIPIDSLVSLGRGMGMFDSMPTTLRMARGRIGGLVNDLKKHCLLLDGKARGDVKMHGVVRDVAISITLEGHTFFTGGNLQQWPERKPYNLYNVVSLTFDEDIPQPPNGFECPKLHTIMLKCKRRNGCAGYIIRNPYAFFKKMRKLQVLVLRDMKIFLRRSMLLLDDLRVLCLEDCDLGDISLVGKFKKLEMLILRGSKVLVLPMEVGDSTCLKLLDLRNCKDLKTISPAAISRLSKLEELFMPMRFEMWGRCAINGEERSADLAAELKTLNQLESLELYVPNFEMLPPVPCFPFWDKLSNFKISVQAVFDGEEYEQRRNVMKLGGVPLTRGVELLLKRVEALYMRELKDLKHFKLQGRDKENFSHLEYLQAHSCEGMQEFLGKVLDRPILSKPPYSKVSVLKVISCNMNRLLSPSAVNALVFLHRLEIEGCKNIEAVVWSNDVAPKGGGQLMERLDMVIFPQLKYLKLEDLPKLVSFYPKMKQTVSLDETSYFPALPLFNDKIGFPSLRELILKKLGKVKEIWMDGIPPPPNSFWNLTDLEIRECHNLVRAFTPGILPRLQQLEFVNVSDCHSIREVMEVGVGSEEEEEEEEDEEEEEGHGGAVNASVSVLPKLKQIWLWDLPKLECLLWETVAGAARGPISSTQSFLAFQCLSIIDIRRCGRLRNLFSSHSIALAFACNLRRLEIGDCEKMGEIVSCGSMGKEVELAAPAASSFVAALNHDVTIIFPKLENLILRNLPNLRSLFCPSGYLLYQESSLKHKYIEGCPNLQETLTYPNTLPEGILMPNPSMFSLFARILVNSEDCPGL